MGLLEFLGLRARGGDRHLVVVTFEGPGRLRLNANRSSGPRAKRGAAAHARTVGWIELTPDGRLLDHALGPAAPKLGTAEVTALLRQLPADPACKSVLRDLGAGRPQASKVLSFEDWGTFGAGAAPNTDPSPG
ncbi:MAG TPA: hypothetical protein VM597_17650 [Gemmataceae bacterium]|jgi:hypothetical protein|nr:hypothetical protein [Gemmataceae bacterium]